MANRDPWAFEDDAAAADGSEPDEDSLSEVLPTQQADEGERELEGGDAPPLAPPPPWTTSALGAKRVDELKQLCRMRGLPVSGRKELLIARLMGEPAPVPKRSRKPNANKASAARMLWSSSSSEEDEAGAPAAGVPAARRLKKVQPREEPATLSPEPQSTSESDEERDECAIM